MNNADSTADEDCENRTGDELEVEPRVGFVTLWLCGVADDVVVRSGAW